MTQIRMIISSIEGGSVVAIMLGFCEKTIVFRVTISSIKGGSVITIMLEFCGKTIICSLIAVCFSTTVD